MQQAKPSAAKARREDFEVDDDPTDTFLKYREEQRKEAEAAAAVAAAKAGGATVNTNNDDDDDDDASDSEDEKRARAYAKQQLTPQQRVAAMSTADMVQLLKGRRIAFSGLEKPALRSLVLDTLLKDEGTLEEEEDD